MQFIEVPKGLDHRSRHLWTWKIQLPTKRKFVATMQQFGDGTARLYLYVNRDDIARRLQRQYG